MPRDIPLDLEAGLDSQQSGDGLLWFLTITHPRLSEPVRAVSSPYGDNVGACVLNGQLYSAIPFRGAILTDDDRVPRGTLEVLNYGLTIGRAVRWMRTRCRLVLEQYAAADFTTAMTGTPPAHQPIGTPARSYRASGLTLVNVQVGTWVTGTLAPFGPDLTTEPASSVFASEDILPGLAR